MRNSKTWLWIILIVIILAISWFIYRNYFIPKIPEDITIDTNKILSLDNKKEKTHLSKVADTKGVYWMRGFDILWNEIEPKKGEINWDSTDEKIKEMNEGEIYLLPIVQPFANWDQETCHSEEKYFTEDNPKRGGRLGVGKPCDMNAYEEFLQKATERYDGDGKDDMPGLKIPIKYWEIINEPSMQGGQSGGMGEDLKFFVGTKEEYLDILKTSYETIKKADSDAKVLHAGMAGMQKEAVDFFEPIFSAEGGKYFDIANNHTISTDEGREDLSMIKFKDLLTSRGLGDKPVWLTEVQFGSLQEKPKDLTEFEKLMARATVFALSKGAEKLFYIENWLMWEKDEAQKEKKPTPLDKNNSTNKVYLNLVNTMNQFDKIETIKEDYVLNQRQDEGATSKIGQYKIINGSNIIYALWGKAELPSEITGKIIVTDIYGEKNETDAEKLTLSDSPVFIEIAR